MRYERSSALFKAAQSVIPGGVNSPVRAFQAVGGTPIFVDHAKGAYLYDEDQSVAQAYNAVCTPDFFGFNASGGLQYRGRLDAAGRNPAPEGLRRDLVEAMRMIADTGAGPQNQIPSMGCSIKWHNPV